MGKQLATFPKEDTDLCGSLLDEEEIVLRSIFTHITDKWSLCALGELVKESPLRFSRLLDRMDGVSQKSLTATLRQLERNGLVARKVTVQVPIRVDYEATPLGVELIVRVFPLWMWVLRNRHEFSKWQKTYDEIKNSEDRAHQTVL